MILAETSVLLERFSMATVYQRKGGYWVVQFSTPDGESRRIHLGSVSGRDAQRLRDKVESLVRTALFGMPPDEAVAKWTVAIAGTPLASKLQAHGLLRQGAPRKLGAFLGEYIRLRSDVKASTRSHMVSCERRLVGFFGAEKLLSEVTRGDAEAFRIHLLGKYSRATSGRTLKAAIQFLDHAVNSRLVIENPFRKLKIPRETNEARMFFVSGVLAQRVLQASASLSQKVAFALARYGGLRVPSELVQLRWCDILWDQGRFLVHSPKTEHHEGKGKRWVPLFPELREVLEEAYRARGEGQEQVCEAATFASVNLRMGLLRTLRKAGIEPWPKLFANLRSSRETELVDNFPIQVVTKWIGHTPEVAKMHYLQVLDRHWESASRTRTVYDKAPGGGDPGPAA